MIKNISLKATWDLNKDKSYQNIKDEELQWGSFKLVNADIVTELTAKNIVQELPGELEIVVDPQISYTGAKVEHNKVIFEIKNEITVSNLISDGDYYGRMLDYLPWYERNTKAYIAVLKALDSELRRLEHGRKLIHDNLFIMSSNDALKYWERDFGLKNTKDLGLKERQEMVRARWIHQFGQLTEEKLKTIIESFTNATCILIKDYETCVLTIEFDGLIGRPKNLEGIFELLEIILPAHWGFEFVIRYNTWGDFNEYIWQELRIGSWDEIRSWKGVDKN